MSQLETFMSQFVLRARLLAFYAVVLIGTVLSIISIVVVLELRAPRSVPPEHSPDQLRAGFKSARLMFEARHAIPIPLQFDSADLALAREDKSPRGRALIAFHAAQQELVRQWEARRKGLLAESVEAGEAAALSYAAEGKRPGERDRLVRFMEVGQWHHQQTRKADAYLEGAHTKLGDVNEALLALREARDPAAAVEIKEVTERFRAARLALSRSHAYEPLPVRVDPPLIEFIGGRVRIHGFSALTGWMRSQQSPELASILGMLGFGLLGAAAATFIRRPRVGRGKVQIGENLTALVVSGTTAAFATYLAMKGSLAIVSTDGAEPNPYVLLLTCFVAAVYWEEAWERVRGAVGRNQGADDASREYQQATGASGERGKVAVPVIVSSNEAESEQGRNSEQEPQTV